MFLNSNGLRGPLGVAIVALTGLLATDLAAAQTARNLDCSGCVNSQDIKNGGINSKDIKDGQVKNKDLSAKAVDSSKIADGEVKNADLAKGAVDSDKIRNNAVDSNKIADGEVKNADLAKGAVNSDKIQPNAVDSSKIADGEVKNADLANDAVNSDKIQNNAITSSKVASESLKSLDLGDEAGVEFVGGSQTIRLTDGTDKVVRSVTVTAPRDGFVIVNASGTLSLPPDGDVKCSLTTGTTIDLSNDRHVYNEVGYNTQMFGMTDVFVVAVGTTTFRLVCNGDQDYTYLVDTHMNALYVPTRY